MTEVSRLTPGVVDVESEIKCPMGTEQVEGIVSEMEERVLTEARRAIAVCRVVTGWGQGALGRSEFLLASDRPNRGMRAGVALQLSLRCLGDIRCDLFSEVDRGVDQGGGMREPIVTAFDTLHTTLLHGLSVRTGPDPGPRLNDEAILQSHQVIRKAIDSFYTSVARYLDALFPASAIGGSGSWKIRVLEWRLGEAKEEVRYPSRASDLLRSVQRGALIGLEGVETELVADKWRRKGLLWQPYAMAWIREKIGRCLNMKAPLSARVMMVPVSPYVTGQGGVRFAHLWGRMSRHGMMRFALPPSTFTTERVRAMSGASEWSNDRRRPVFECKSLEDVEGMADVAAGSVLLLRQPLESVDIPGNSRSSPDLDFLLGVELRERLEERGNILLVMYNVRDNELERELLARGGGASTYFHML